MSEASKHLLVIGANGTLGRAVIAEALAQNCTIRAAVRSAKDYSAPNGVTDVVEFNVKAEDKTALEEALKDVDAVICTVVAKSSKGAMSVGMKNVVLSMIARDTERVIFASCNAAREDGYATLSYFQRLFTYGIRLRHQVADMSAMERYFQAEKSGEVSEVCYTMVYLPLLAQRHSSNRDVVVTEDGVATKVLSSMSYIDAAKFLVKCATKSNWEHAAVSIGLKK